MREMAESMTTAIICGGAPMGGKELMALELGEGLRSRGVAVEFVTSRWSNGDFEARLQNLGIPAHSVWFGFISLTLRLDCLRMTAHQLLKWPNLLLGYRGFLRRAVPQCVVHTNWHSLLMILPFANPKRDLFWLHDVIPNKPHYRLVFGWFSRRLECFVPVSHAVAESLRQIGIADNKIQVVHNGLIDPFLNRKPPPARLCGIRIGIVGRVGEWKGHEDLLDAFEKIASKFSGVELHIFGSSTADYESKLRMMADRLGIAPNIVWHGFVGSRESIFSELDICAVPSRCSDSLPTVAIEAAFFGLPVVATRRGGLPEIVEDGVTGYLVEPERPHELAERLKALIENPELRAKMGAAGRERATKYFGRERFVDDFLRVLGEENQVPTSSVSAGNAGQ